MSNINRYSKYVTGLRSLNIDIPSIIWMYTPTQKRSQLTLPITRRRRV
ncbi:hypothetical protein K9N68_06675 [Kovacikia minuta CCNUW1]|nr:hypothetical protein [Kovacikia minuta]UBF27603.1 hypothetical protein K9N68_06675 [Kovacikia minuta CCNUW1]